MPLEVSQAACSIAKIIRLIGPVPREEDAQFSNEFDLADKLVQQNIVVSDLWRKNWKSEQLNETVSSLSVFSCLWTH